MATETRDILAQRVHTFCGIEFEVSPGVLVPRAETELLAETAASLLKGGSDLRIVDMCCGAGNITGTLALRFPDAVIYGADLTALCVRLAQRNVSRHAIGGRVSIHQGYLFDSLHGLGLEECVDLVVCNPPYIPTSRLETSARALLDHEPREAFDAGAYGMDVIGKLIPAAAAFLKPGAPLCFEFGEGQHRMCKWLIEQSKLYENIRLVENENGAPRVAVAFRKA